MKLGHEPVPPRESYNIFTCQHSWYYIQEPLAIRMVLSERGACLGCIMALCPQSMRLWSSVLCTTHFSLLCRAIDYLFPERELKINVDDMSNKQHTAFTKGVLVVVSCRLSYWGDHKTLHCDHTEGYCSACWSGDYVQLSPASCEADLQPRILQDSTVVLFKPCFSMS